MSGWGNVSEDDTWFTDNLLSLIVPVIDRSTCKDIFHRLLTIYDSMIYAGEEGHDFYKGDIGGPIRDVYGNCLAGIVSSGTVRITS